MADNTVLIAQQQLKPIKVLKWKVSVGSVVAIGRVILLYDFEDAAKVEQRKLKSTQAGTVHELLAPEGAIVQSGEPLLKLKACIHPTVMNDMCAECGADLRKEELSPTASVPMVHSIPELKVSEEVAQKLGRADGERLIRDRKLVLLVDLDQTLIHTTNDNVSPNIKDVYHFQLYGPNSPWYHTRLRPGTHTFLNNISKFFELHICTFGARNYAHMIAMFLDGDQTYFSNRILSRDECFDPTSKKANLKALFPCGDNMVCIIDDREDVWNHASNLIHVKPYHFFKHTGDINAPPGLDKQDADFKDGVDFNTTKNTKLNGKSERIEAEETVTEIQVDEVLKNGVEKTDQSEEIVQPAVDNNPVENKDEESSQVANEIDEIAKSPNESDEKSVVTAEDDINNDEINQVNETPDENVTENDDENINENKVQTEEKSGDANYFNDTTTQRDGDDLLEMEDSDDYLMYLEDILKLVHRRFYESYDKLEAGSVPDLKVVIPAVRSEILRGMRLVFSGLVPTHIKLEQSKAYQVARSLGAIVTQDIDNDSTHLVAVRPGTAKVNAGRRKKHVKIVTPDWLWACAERWEHVEEAMYPLNSKGSKNRHPPPHCSSPEHMPNYPTHDQPAIRRRTPSGRFMDTINPLMSFSSDDIADMDKEVEDILDDESDDSDDQGDKMNRTQDVETDVEDSQPLPGDNGGLIDDNSSSSSSESLTSEFPRGFKRLHEEMKADLPTDTNAEGDSTTDDMPSAKFRRGEKLDSDLDIGDDSNSEGSTEPIDEAEDGEWNMMGAALEREFLSNN